MHGLKKRFWGGRQAALAKPLVPPPETTEPGPSTPSARSGNTSTPVASNSAPGHITPATTGKRTESGLTSTTTASATTAAAPPPPVPLVVVSPATESSVTSGALRRETDSTAPSQRRRSSFFSSAHLAKRTPSFRSLAARDKKHRVAEDMHEQLYSTYCLSWPDLRAWLVEKFPDVDFPTGEEYDVDGDNYVFQVPRALTPTELKEIWYLRSDKKKKLATRVVGAAS